MGLFNRARGAASQSRAEAIARSPTPVDQLPEMVVFSDGKNPDGSTRLGTLKTTRNGEKFEMLPINSIRLHGVGLFRFELAGGYFHADSEMDCFSPGSGVILARAPKNKADTNAIEVRCAAHAGIHHAGFLGHLLAAQIAPLVGTDATWSGLIVDSDSPTPGEGRHGNGISSIDNKIVIQRLPNSGSGFLIG